MCGIVGYIGDRKATPILIEGLLKLEYRGYDSAGIATIEEDNISVLKKKGRVNNLKELEETGKLKGSVGIAHTRWATHGEPSDVNSHPHQDNSKTFAVVHNGIIENYNELREFLKSKGYHFLSQTDTEVIPNLIHYNYAQDKENDSKKLLRAINKTCTELKGSYAIEVISKEFPDKMIVARKDSPLVIGKGNNENYICSDIPAVLSHTREFLLLDDNEIAELERDKVTIYDSNLSIVEKQIKNIDWNAGEIEKGEFEDFMLKEIYEQPKAITQTIGNKLNDDKIKFSEIELTKDYLVNVNRIYIVACGTAMHAGLATKQLFERYTKIPTEVDISSEFRYREPLVDEKTLAIFISQSGETADTIAALKLVKSKNAKVIAISNVIGSSITREADYSIYTHAGPEIAVASTKAYTSQITVLSILAMYLSEVLEKEEYEKEIEKLKEDLVKLPKKIEELLKDTMQVKEFAKQVHTEKDMFFLGRGIDYACGLEGSLKLKEISYIHSECYASGELKHGPIALIEKGITVVSIITDKKLLEKTISNIQEVVSRGAKILVVTNQDLGEHKYDNIIRIPETNSLISAILAIVPLQLFSYYISKEKGLDVDKPRNLAKSVTVE